MEYMHGSDRLHYEIAGEGSAPVLLLHGWGGSTESWLPLWRDLQTQRRLINLDFPGFGQSPEPSVPWTVGDYASLLIDFLDELNEPRVDIVAHSFGGRVALKMNSVRPELVRRQLLTGCAGLRSREDAARDQKGKSRLYDNALTRRLLGDEGVKKLRDFVRSHFGSEDYKNASPRMREVFKNVISEDLSCCLDGVKASTLLIWGENDTATPLWMGKEMEKRIPDAALVVFQGAGHFAYLEQYQRFFAIAKQFLSD